MKEVERAEYFECGGDRERRNYGIRLHMTDGAVISRENVDCDKDSIHRLIACLQNQSLDAEQLQYILEDHLAREYTV